MVNEALKYPLLVNTIEYVSLQIGSRIGTLPDIMIEGQNFSVQIPTLEDVSSGGGNRLPEFATPVLDGLPAIVEPTRIRSPLLDMDMILEVEQRCVLLLTRNHDVAFLLADAIDESL